MTVNASHVVKRVVSIVGGVVVLLTELERLRTRLQVVLIQLNFKSGKPVYLQIVDQIKSAAASGAIKPGEPLPTIRPLAEELRVNRNTVARAYAELESQGIIESRHGKGSFLAENHSPLKKDIRRKMLVAEIDQAVVQAHHLQFDRAEFLKLVDDRFDALEAKQTQNKEGAE